METSEIFVSLNHNLEHDFVLTFSATKIQALIRRYLVRCRILNVVFDRYEKIFDPKRKRYYYYDRKTDKSSWLKPALLLSQDISTIAPTYTKYQAALKIQTRIRMYISRLNVRIMYQGVISTVKDSDSGYQYYLNTLIGTTMWELPSFMNGRLDYKKLPPKAPKKSNSKQPKVKVNDNGDTKNKKSDIGDDEEKDDDDDDEEEEEQVAEKEEGEESDASEDSEIVRERRRQRRRYPRSRIQLIVDEAEDNLYETNLLDLSSLDAPHISNRIYDFHELTALNLSYNRLKRINPNIQYLDKLRVLDVRGNKIEFFPREMESLVEIREFYASHNRCIGYPGQFYKLVNMEILDISFNQFEELPLETGNLELLKEIGEWEIGIGMMKKLRVFDMRNNKVKAWPPQVDMLANLQELYLSYNQISTIPPEISDLTNLKVFHVSGNQLTRLPPEIYELTIETLRAQQNQIVDLPACKGDASKMRIPSLKVLDLSMNSLSTIDERLSIFTGLQSLMLQENRIQITSESCFSRLTSLTYLDLSRNQLSAVSASISLCASLTYFDLSYNNLKEVPSGLYRVTKLKVLKINNNVLEELSGKVIGMLVDLERLEAQCNAVRSLSTMLFGIRKVIYADLSYNQIVAIPEEVRAWSKLIYLDASFNKLETFSMGLCNLSQLHTLHLRNNAITEIPSQIANLVSLKHISIEKNNLQKLPRVLELVPSLQYVDMSWNLGLSGLIHAEVGADGNASLRRLENALIDLDTSIDVYIKGLQQREEDFICSRGKEPRNFALFLKSLRMMRRHFLSRSGSGSGSGSDRGSGSGGGSGRGDTTSAVETFDKMLEELKNQSDSLSFNSKLRDILTYRTEASAIVKDKLFFGELSLSLNRPAKWFPTFLETDRDRDEREPEKVLIGDALSYVFLPIEIFSYVDQACEFIRELNTLARCEELKCILAHTSDSPSAPAEADEEKRLGSRPGSPLGQPNQDEAAPRSQTPPQQVKRKASSKRFSFSFKNKREKSSSLALGKSISAEVAPLGVSIQSNDLSIILSTLQSIIDSNIFNDSSHSKEYKAIPVMVMPYTALAEEESEKVKAFLGSKSSLKESPYNQSLFALYFDANIALIKCLLAQVELVQRAIRSIERANRVAFSALTIGQRTVYRYVNASQELTVCEDYEDILADIYASLQQDQRETEEKAEKKSLAQKREVQVNEFLQQFQELGGFTGSGLEDLLKGSAEDEAKESLETDQNSIGGDSQSANDMADIQSFVSQQEGNGAVERTPKELVTPEFRGLLSFLSEYRALALSWALQALDNCQSILKSRGFDCSNIKVAIASFPSIRDPRDPANRVSSDPEEEAEAEADSALESAQVTYQLPATILQYLTQLARKMSILQARANQFYGNYAEAAASYQNYIDLCFDRVNKSVYLEYVKVILANGQFAKARQLLQLVIRKFLMAGGEELEEESLTDVELLKLDRNVALLSKYTNVSLELLANADVYSERNKRVYRADIYGNKAGAGDSYIPPEFVVGRGENFNDLRAALRRKQKLDAEEREQYEVRSRLLERQKELIAEAKFQVNKATEAFIH